jgi:hypothetical protein
MSTCFCACSRCLAGDCCQNRWNDPFRPYWVPPQPYNPYIPMVPWPDTQTVPYNPTTKTNITLTYVPLACSKCGSADIRTRWHQHTFITGFPNEGRGNGCSYEERSDWPEGEHLHRTCQACGYVWATAVIGSSK